MPAENPNAKQKAERSKLEEDHSADSSVQQLNALLLPSLTPLCLQFLVMHFPAQADQEDPREYELIVVCKQKIPFYP